VEELIKQVTQKAGISDAQAKQAVETVMGFLKDKLPAPIASQIEGVLSGSGSLDIGDVGDQLGGILGKK
jgi:nucleoid DNA-binding protein